MMPIARDLMRALFQQSSVLFIGCSAEALLADLNAMEPGEMRASHHYAVVGVSKLNWEESAG